MAKTDNLTDFLKGLADKFRATLGGGKINPQSFEDKVDEVFEKGKQAEYDSFWNEYQNNGKYYISYRGKFYSWNTESFKPKYDIKAAYDCERMFCYFGADNNPFDMSQLLASRGITLDTSRASNMRGAYNGCNATNIDLIDLSSATTAADLLRYAGNLVTVGEVRLSSTTQCALGSAFQNAPQLENIKFTGAIFSQYISFDGTEKLSRDSLISLLNALENQAPKGTTSGLALRTANLNKLTDEEKAIATQKGWTLI